MVMCQNPATVTAGYHHPRQRQYYKPSACSYLFSSTTNDNHPATHTSNPFSICEPTSNATHTQQQAPTTAKITSISPRCHQQQRRNTTGHESIEQFQQFIADS